MKVVYHPDCLLHDPPYEILSGRLVPYFESPARVERILKELRQHDGYDISDTLETLDTEQHILAVHSQDYLDYLKTAYDEWILDGGDKVLWLYLLVLSHQFMAYLLDCCLPRDNSQYPFCT